MGKLLEKASGVVKNKAIMIPAVFFLAIAVVSAAVIYYQHTSVDVTVSESLSQSVDSVSVSSFPAETQVLNFTVGNAASVPTNTLVTFVEDINANGVTYTTDTPKTLLLASGSNIVNITITIMNDSTVGNFNGTASFGRTN